MVLKIIIAVLIIAAATAIGLKNGIDWSRDRAESWGKSHMEELGVLEEKRKQDD